MNDPPKKYRAEIEVPDGDAMRLRRMMMQSEPFTDAEILGLVKQSIESARKQGARSVAVVFETNPLAPPATVFFVAGAPATRATSLLVGVCDLLNYGVQDLKLTQPEVAQALLLIGDVACARYVAEVQGRTK